MLITKRTSGKFSFTAMMLSSLLILFTINDALAVRTISIGDFNAVVLYGSNKLLPGCVYVAIAGDYGFRRKFENVVGVHEFGSMQRDLFRDFDAAVVNFEFLIGESGHLNVDFSPVDYLSQSGFTAVSFANNHAMDYGAAGLDKNIHQATEAGLDILGVADSRFIEVTDGRQRIVIASATALLDAPNEGEIIPTVESFIKDQIVPDSAEYDLLVVFLHLGSRSVYPNPHEVSLINRLIDAGAGAVVSSGSHWPKGFLVMDEVPVAFGTGNYLFSYTGGGTEAIGSYIVIGVKDGRVAQVLMIPFHNSVDGGKLGPLDELEISSFIETIDERSVLDSSKFYADDKTRKGMWARLSGMTLSDMSRLQLRHFIYGAKTLWYSYSFYVIILSVIIFAIVFIVAIKKSRVR